MVIEFSAGKVIANGFELMIRINGPQQMTMQAQSDAVTLIGKGANVIAVHASEAKWSVKLDNESQLEQVAEALGISVQ